MLALLRLAQALFPYNAPWQTEARLPNKQPRTWIKKLSGCRELLAKLQDARSINGL